MGHPYIRGGIYMVELVQGGLVAVGLVATSHLGGLTQDTTAIGALVFLAMVLSNMVNRLVDRIIKGKGGGGPEVGADGRCTRCGFGPHQREQLSSLVADHSVVDGDGVKMWYQPRSWGGHLIDLLKAVRDLGEGQRKTCRVMEEILEEQRAKGGAKG